MTPLKWSVSKCRRAKTLLNVSISTQHSGVDILPFAINSNCSFSLAGLCSFCDLTVTSFGAIVLAKKNTLWMGAYLSHKVCHGGIHGIIKETFWEVVLLEGQGPEPRATGTECFLTALSTGVELLPSPVLCKYLGAFWETQMPKPMPKDT